MKFGIDKKQIETHIPEGLKEWLKAVSVHRKKSNHAGAIVMNCNPFTKGHHYLVSEAAKRVDIFYLYI